jgi:amino acid transporter
MILWTAMASVFALLLGYSRIPYAAAVEGYFFAPFGWLHPSAAFPHVSLAVIGLLSIAAGMFSLEAVLPALITARILVQFIGQIGALHWLRTHRPDMDRPFRMWLYPLPSLVALTGWSYVFLTSGWTYVLYGLGVVVSGVAAFALWRAGRA